MSLDLCMNTKPCEHCGRSDESVDFNVTYNLSKMWCEASGDDRIINVDGMTGKESLPKLEKGLAELKANPDKYKHYNPGNGWGSYDGLVSTLEKIVSCAKEHPDGKWSSWR